MEKTNFTDDNFCCVEGGKSNKDGNEKRNRSSWRGWRKRGTGRGGNVQVKGDAENSICNTLSNGEGELKRIQSKRGRGRGFRGRNSYRGNGNRQTLLQVEESCSGDIVDNGGNGYNKVKNDRYTYYRRSRQKKKIDETCASAMKDTRNDNSELGISFSDVEYKKPGVKNEQSQRGRSRGSFKQRYGSRENECVQRDNDTVTCIKRNGENDCNQRPCSSPNRGRGGNRGRGRGGRQKKRQDIVTVETYQSKTTNDNDNISFSERESWRGRGWYRGRGSYRGGEKFNQGRNSAKMNNHRGRSADVKVPPTTNLNNGAEEKHISLAFQSAKRNSVVTPTLASETSRDDCTVPNSKQTVGKIIFLQKPLKVASPIALQNVPSVPRDKHGQASNKIINQLNSKSSSLIKQSSSSVSSISSSNLSKVSHTEPVRSSKLSSVTKIYKFNTSATSSSAKTTTNSVTSAAAVTSISPYVPSNKVQDSQSSSSISAPKVASTNKLSSVTNKDKFNTSATSASAKTTTNSVTSAAAVKSKSLYVPSNKVQDSQSFSSISAPKVASTNKLSSVTNKDKFNTSATLASAKTTTNSVTSAAAVKSKSPYVPSNKVQDIHSSSSISASKVTSPNNANMFHRTASLPSKNSSFGMALTAKSKISENTTLSPTLSLQSQNLKKISYKESKDSTINKLSFDVRNSCKLVIKSYGNVVHGKSDIIVSFLESTMTMRNTPTGQAILLASPTHEEELKHYKLQPSTQILFIHTPRNLTCKAVCHIVLQPWQLNFSEPFFHRSLNLVFREVEKIQAKSVSFPPLGCDSPFFFPTTTAVQSFLESLSDLNIDDSLKKIVVHATSSDLFQEFKRLAPYYFDRAENRQKIKTQTLIQQIQPLQRNTVNFLKYAIEKDEIFPIYWKLRTPEINNDTETNETTWTGIFVKIIVTAVSSWFGGESTPCFKQATLENVDYETKAAITTLVKRTLHPDVIGHGADAFGVRYSSVKVIDVKRIENPTLFKKYHATRKFMMEKMIMKGHLCQNIGKLRGSKGPVVTWDYLPDSLQEELYSEINENYLFHGTNTKAVHSIIENGFDLSYSKDWTLFGKGIYGAEKAMKSDQYADNKGSRCPNGTKLTMILTRMLLGNVFVCDENNKMVSRLGAQRRFRHPPCMYCQVDLCYCGNPDHYDSVMGDGKWLFREFVVYNASQCYPEYVITYERV